MKAEMTRLKQNLRHHDAMTEAAGDSPGRLLANVSVIIPVAPDDDSWRSLVGDLSNADTQAELLLIGARPEPTDWDRLHAHEAPSDVHWVATASGRALQMNLGAKLATRPFLWLLHADTRLNSDAIEALEGSLKIDPNAIHYFDLLFQDDGPGLVWLNAFGVRIRSRIFGLPFGDQGLCMSREVFERLGRFDESASYGEDHLLVWSAHCASVPLRRVSACIATSARKYRDQGWFRTTFLHGWRTWRQAAPQLLKLLCR